MMRQKLLISTTLMILSILFLYPNINESKAQTNLTNFLTYTNTDYGFTIMYPDNWGVNQSNPVMGIKFNSPDNAGNVIVHKTNDISLEEIIKGFKSTSLNSFGARLIEINNTYVLSGQPATRIVFMATFGGPGEPGESQGMVGDVKFMNFLTSIGDNLYTVSYLSSPDRFPDYLDTAQKMIDSFQIISKE